MSKEEKDENHQQNEAKGQPKEMSLKDLLKQLIEQGHGNDAVCVHIEGEGNAVVYEIEYLSMADCFLSKGKVIKASEYPMMNLPIKQIIPCSTFIPRSRRTFCLVEIRSGRGEIK